MERHGQKGGSPSDHEGKFHSRGGIKCKGLIDSFKLFDKLDLKEGETFMDAACGDGHISIAASEIVGSTGRVLAVDSYRAGLETLVQDVNAKGLENMEMVLADPTSSFPLPDETVDVCLLANALHSYARNGNLPGAMSELTRTIKKEGRLAIIEPCKEKSLMGPPLDIRINAEEVEKLVKPHGLRFEEVVDIGTGHYAVLFVKNKK